MTTLEFPIRWDNFNCIFVMQVVFSLNNENEFIIDDIEVVEIMDLQIAGQDYIETNFKKINEFFKIMESLNKNYVDEITEYIENEIRSKKPTSVFQDISDAFAKIYLDEV